MQYAAPRNVAPIMTVENLSLFYGTKQALKNVSFDLYQSEILAFIRPSGCKKSTALKCLNPMHDGTRGVKIEGTITMHGHDTHAYDIDPPVHIRRFGWVAQKPKPFPATVWENVAYGARIHGLKRNRADMAKHVDACLKRASLWDEVKDRLHTQEGTALPGGQQRLCIARALATEPEAMLIDEPTGSIDPIATPKIEELRLDLREDHSVVVITHSMMETHRTADRVAYFHLGALLKLGPNAQIFGNAQTPECRDFVAERFC